MTVQWFFAIRHKPSRTYLPLFKGGQRRGTTYIDLPFVGAPRLFTTQTAARNCLRWWLAGVPTPEYDTDEWSQSEVKVGASPGKGDPNRKAEDMEVVKVTLVVKP